ncbi:uncharacterized protein N7459_006542 [Penicillium hispanicum]|uniref:uncharacterized protein n=1 Tax=Penicillium hispanicum TaxID=1080232 RepID=UPI002541A4F4|nr:uncharacterized protein N7459_006542 [Penicillium hispanicum]KAJ5577578.1 hypothetical protein N7459_006542 [Penicillium hispanicum]
MAAAPNIYTAEPAYPVLAHSLLAQREPRRPVYDTAIIDDWNLQHDWDAGIQSSQTTLFHCGSVIGFSRLRTRSNDSDEYVGQVSINIFFYADLLSARSHTRQIPRHLLTTHLLQSAPLSDPSAFIIHPSSFDAFAPSTLLNALRSPSNGAGLSREDAIRLLDSVQLLPVHNFPSAAQAIGQVSGALQQIQERRQQTTDHERLNNPPIMLIVAGLDTLAEGIVRASNPVKGAAVLGATLRTLTRISRAYASFVCVILVNTSGLGPTHFESNRQPDSATQPRNRNTGEDDARSSGDDGVRSIFQASGPSLLSTLLMKTLDQGIDSHILLSDVKSAPVAEVIKDRVGTGLGKWGIWTRN